MDLWSCLPLSKSLASGAIVDAPIVRRGRDHRHCLRVEARLRGVPKRDGNICENVTRHYPARRQRPTGRRIKPCKCADPFKPAHKASLAGAPDTRFTQIARGLRLSLAMVHRNRQS